MPQPMVTNMHASLPSTRLALSSASSDPAASPAAPSTRINADNLRHEERRRNALVRDVTDREEQVAVAQS